MEDYERPLNPEILPQIHRTQKENAKRKDRKSKIKVKRKKHVMSAMDTLLTLFVVTPLIVGQWRGTWEMMSFYPQVFPAWESFIFGGVLHLSFAIVKEGLQDLINFRKTTWYHLAIAYFLRRLYTYLFAVACIMNWRGGWVLFDEWLEMETLPDGRVIPGNYTPIVIGIFVLCPVLLGLLRSCRNILAAPFVIGLDTKSTAFDFPTRFRLTISYTTVYAVNSKIIENNTHTIVPSIVPNPKAEPLTVTVEKQVVEPFSPRPFLNDLRGASPAGFFEPYTTTTPANYAYFPNHRTPARPNNIQDIIQYLTENAHRQKELIREEQQNFASSNRDRDRFKHYGTVQNSRIPYKQYQDNYNLHYDGFNNYNAHQFSQYPQDPFFAYKPQDPSDINLLAPTSFRFAPALLAPSFYKNRQKLIQEAVNTVNETRIIDGLKKPLTLMLNIYPFGDPSSANRNQFQGPGLTPRYRYQGQRARNMLASGRMVVHLNLYPGAPNNNFNRNFNNQEIDQRRFLARRNVH